MKHLFLLLFCCVAGLSSFAQQVADSAFAVHNPHPRYAPGAGPVVWLDEAHYNFHTLDGRYLPFGNVVRQDGYRIEPNRAPFTTQSLAGCRILVIANAVDSASEGSKGWRLPAVSAFSKKEIKAVQKWVKKGGSLLLIADHMPFAGANGDLALAFGVDFLNCFAMDTLRPKPDLFFRKNNTLLASPISAGLDTVATFTGSAFTIPKNATPVLALRGFDLWMPEVAWEFNQNTPARKSEGTYQMACLTYGKGKVVVSGEAAMFSAQLAGPNRRPAGMNHPKAQGNGQLLLNVLHWLE